MLLNRLRLTLPAALVAASALLGPATTQAAAANLFADVSQAGTLSHGSGVGNVSHLGTGQYEVTFTAPVTGCAYIATTNNAYSQALNVFTASGHLSTNGVYVETKNQGGGLTDGPFDLAVNCGGSGSPFAVVGYNSNLVRASAGTSLADLGSGRYTLSFKNSVQNCAYLATVADPANGLVYAPSGVYTASGPNANSIYIETKNPGGGLQSGVPFHVSVLCPNARDVRTIVVGANGVPTRGTSLTSAFLDSTGNYDVVSDRDLSACAAVATRGSTSSDVPFNPATLEITPGLAPNTVGIQERNLLFFGGNLMNEAFHAAIVC
jgi:hypothetical protein